MKRIDNRTKHELAEYIKRAFDEPGPYHIDSWHIYHLNHVPSTKAIEKSEKILNMFVFNDDDEYIFTLRANRTHIHNFT